jgi:hypothetical protein
MGSPTTVEEENNGVLGLDPGDSHRRLQILPICQTRGSPLISPKPGAEMPSTAETTLAVRIEDDSPRAKRRIPAVGPEPRQLLRTNSHAHSGALAGPDQVLGSAIERRKQAPQFEQTTSGTPEQGTASRVFIGEPGPHPRTGALIEGQRYSVAASGRRSERKEIIDGRVLRSTLPKPESLIYRSLLQPGIAKTEPG